MKKRILALALALGMFVGAAPASASTTFCSHPSQGVHAIQTGSQYGHSISRSYNSSIDATWVVSLGYRNSHYGDRGPAVWVRQSSRDHSGWCF